MLLLQNQLKMEPANLEKLQSFEEFVAVFYSSMWFQTPLASEAAHNNQVSSKKYILLNAAFKYEHYLSVTVILQETIVLSSTFLVIFTS